MHFSAEKVDSSRENVGACMPYEVADLWGSVQSPNFVPQPLILPSERVLPSHRSVKLESNLVSRFYKEGPTLGLHPQKLVSRARVAELNVQNIISSGVVEEGMDERTIPLPSLRIEESTDFLGLVYTKFKSRWVGQPFVAVDTNSFAITNFPC